MELELSYAEEVITQSIRDNYPINQDIDLPNILTY